MRIVNVEDYFLPDTGYQINILPKYLKSFGHDVWIVTSETKGVKKKNISFFGTDNIVDRDKKYESLTGVKIIRVKPLLKKPLFNRIVQSNKIFKIVKSLEPDVVFVHGNDTLTAIRFIRKGQRHFKIVTDSHMLDMASKNKFHKLFSRYYKLFVTPKIVKNKIPVIRTQNDDYVKRTFNIPLSQSPWISYGSDTMLFKPNFFVKKDFRKEHNIDDNDFVIIYAGKLDETKGGLFLANVFKNKFSCSKKIVLILVGNSPDNKYGYELDKLFETSHNRIIRFPTQKYFDLPKFYQASDLAIFPKQCSLSFYDAQACGLPVLSEDNNINVDRCNYNNGWNFRSGSVEDMRNKIEFIANMNKDDFMIYSKNAYDFIESEYDYSKKAKEYESVLLSVLGEVKNNAKS